MNSGELAAVAGVTVRALRHYHQMGVLPEPPRSSNGYRRYDVRDLITVIQIKRLAALGIALDRIAGILDGTDDDAMHVLDQLEQELTTQIDRLTAQRDLVSQLRIDSATPDLPPEFARHLVAFAAASPSVAAARINRDQSVLLSHLVGPEGMPQLVWLYSRFSDPDLLPALVDLATRLEDVDSATNAAEVTELVDDFVTTMEPLMRELEAAPPIDLGTFAPILSEYDAVTFSDAQRRALDLIDARLTDIG